MDKLQRHAGLEVELDAALVEGEARVVGRIMAAESAKMAVFYKKAMGKTVEAAVEAAWQPADDERRAQVVDAPPNQVDWWALDQLAQTDPDAARDVWRRIEQAAREELDSGHFAAEALDVVHSPRDRARFLATRDAFNEELQPRGALERGLIDTLVHAYLEQICWWRAYHVRTELRAEEVDTDYGVGRRSPRMGDAAARLEAFEFTDRFNRLFTRTLRALDEHRRRAPVIVQNAGQVNVGERQVNVAR